MKRTPALYLSLIVLTVIGFLENSCSKLGNENEVDYPNVVIIMTDDQGYGEFSCHGNPIVKTTNIDRLEAEVSALFIEQSTDLCGYGKSGGNRNTDQVHLC